MCVNTELMEKGLHKLVTRALTMFLFFTDFHFRSEIFRFVELPKHTKTPEHTGNYQNTLILLVIGNV